MSEDSLQPIKLLLSSALTLLTAAAAADPIAGWVVGPQGTGVGNALVSLSADPGVFAKTRPDGSFTLTGPAGADLTIAALGHATRRGVKVSDSPLEIRLAPDPVLATCVYHLNFDHLRAGAAYSEEEAKTDLHVANAIGFADRTQDPDPALDRAYVDPAVSVDGPGSSLRVRFPKGRLKTSASGVDVRIPLQGTYQSNPFRADELYLSYWVRFSANFDFGKCGGKLPSLGGDYVLDGKRWKGRIMWRNGGSLQFYPELAGGEDAFSSDADRFWGAQVREGGSICQDAFTPYLQTGRWHNIELHYKFETPGREDGYFEGWVDGGRGHKLTNSNRFGFWRPREAGDDITINYLLLSAFLGGSEIEDYGQAEDVHAWFDGFKVSHTRINEYHAVSGTSGTLSARGGPGISRLRAVPGPPGRFELEAGIPWSIHSATGLPVSRGYGRMIDLSDRTQGIYFLRAGDLRLRFRR